MTRIDDDVVARFTDAGDWTEGYDAHIPRVDLVGKAANGHPAFLLMKNQEQGPAGLLSPDLVRDLIAKAAPSPDQSPEVVTVTGSPAAIARMIHSSPVRKADEPTVHITNLNLSDDVAKETPMSTTTDDVVTKAPDEPVTPVEPTDLPDGDPAVPGSPAWEAIDAATAREGIALLGRTKSVITLLATREGLEGLAEHAVDGADANWDLSDACDAIDYAVSVLAVFAANEDIEAAAATMAPDGLEAVGKTVQALTKSTQPLAVLEGLAPITKAGRVLSAANEAAIRGAADALQKVLASLPAAPAADATADVTKETPMATISHDDFLVAAVRKGQLTALSMLDAYNALRAPGATIQVVKAKGDPVTVVFDADGKPLGVIDPADLVPITKPGDDGTDKPADEAPADEAPPADAPPAPETPAPAPAQDAAPIPGTDTIQAPPAKDDVTKTLATQFSNALTEALTPLAKELEANAELARAVTDLQERVTKMGLLPDDRHSPVVNGATGIAPGAADRDGTNADPYADLQKAIEAAPDPITKRAASNALLFAQIKDRFTR